MDYSKFLEENFDAKEWVNSAFRSHKDATVSKDQYATTLVMKLQMFIQEVNSVIEESSQQAIQNLPRVMREIDAVQQECVLLKEQMTSVKQDIQKVEHDTAKSMQTLLELDSVKSRMKAAADALQEADNWTTLSADVEDVFQSQDILAIATKLVGMQQSLNMLSDTPDYTERCQKLEELKNRLEALLSPQIVAAFNSQSMEATQMYTRIFTDIDRLQQMYKYYHKWQKAKLLEAWRNILETNQDETLVEWLNELYDLLISTWHSQIKWCSQVFPDPVPIVCQLITETLSMLDPPLAKLFATHIQEKGETLLVLTELKEISQRFARSLENAIEANMSDDPKHSSSMEKLLQTVYQPYRQYLVRYKTFEEVTLGKSLDNIKLDHIEVLDTVQLMSESVAKLFAASRQANERCLKLTDGFGYSGLLDALKNYFFNYTREVRRVMINIREKTKKSDESTETEDWSHFQHSLRIIQTCGELIMHLEELDQTVLSAILQSVGKFTGITSPIKGMEKRCSSAKNAFHTQAALFLQDQADIQALETFVIKLEEGDYPTVLNDSIADFNKLCEESHRFAFDIVFAQLRGYLIDLPKMEIWTSQSAGGALTSDLPTFSLSPQEYITKIGQYLMTIPQHLEPFTMEDNPGLIAALKHGKLPYTDEQELPTHIADLWLESVAKGTMHVFTEEILKIHQLTSHSTKQLITDIDYLCNVLEDLALEESETLKNIKKLLQASSNEFSSLAEQVPQRLFNAICAMRDMDI